MKTQTSSKFLTKTLIIQIAIIILICMLCGELILGLTLGYRTGGQGEVIDGAYTDDSLYYKMDESATGYQSHDISASGTNWEFIIYDLNGFNIADNDDAIWEYISSSSITIKPINENGSFFTMNVKSYRGEKRFTNLTTANNGEELRIKMPLEYGYAHGKMFTDNQYSNFIDDCYLYTSDGDEFIIDGSNKLMTISNHDYAEFRVTCNFGSELWTVPVKNIYYSDGSIEITNFKGTLWKDGRLYFGSLDELTISKDIRLESVSEAESGHDGAMLPTPGSYWEINFEADGSSDYDNLVGYPFWFFGVVFSIIPIIILIIIKIYITSKRKKTDHTQSQYSVNTNLPRCPRCGKVSQSYYCWYWCNTCRYYLNYLSYPYYHMR